LVQCFDEKPPETEASSEGAESPLTLSMGEWARLRLSGGVEESAEKRPSLHEFCDYVASLKERTALDRPPLDQLRTGLIRHLLELLQNMDERHSAAMLALERRIRAEMGKAQSALENQKATAMATLEMERAVSAERDRRRTLATATASRMHSAVRMRMKEDRDQIKTELETTAEQRAMLLVELEEAEEEARRFRRRAEELEAILYSVTQERDELSTENEELKRELEETKLLLAQERSTTRRLQNEAKQHEEIISRMERERLAMEAEVEKLREEMRSVKAAFEEKRKALKGSLVATQFQKNVSKATAGRLKGELGEAQVKIEEDEELLQEAESKAERLKAEISELEDNVDTLQEEKKAAIDNLTGQLKEMEGVLDDARHKGAAARNQAAALRITGSLMTDVGRSKDDRIAELERLLAAREAELAQARQEALDNLTRASDSAMTSFKPTKRMTRLEELFWEEGEWRNVKSLTHWAAIFEDTSAYLDALYGFASLITLLTYDPENDIDGDGEDNPDTFDDNVFLIAGLHQPRSMGVVRKAFRWLLHGRAAGETLERGPRSDAHYRAAEGGERLVAYFPPNLGGEAEVAMYVWVLKLRGHAYGCFAVIGEPVGLEKEAEKDLAYAATGMEQCLRAMIEGEESAAAQCASEASETLGDSATGAERSEELAEQQQLLQTSMETTSFQQATNELCRYNSPTREMVAVVFAVGIVVGGFGAWELLLTLPGWQALRPGGLAAQDEVEIPALPSSTSDLWGAMRRKLRPAAFLKAVKRHEAGAAGAAAHERPVLRHRQLRCARALVGVTAAVETGLELANQSDKRRPSRAVGDAPAIKRAQNSETDTVLGTLRSWVLVAYELELSALPPPP